MKSKFGNIVFSLVKHLIAFGAVIFSWLPLAKLYLSQFPPVGADFYQYVNFTAYIQKFMAWPAASWKYIWFSGHPTFFDYGILHSYLTLPLTKFFNITDASRFYLIGTLGLYLIFAYLLFWELSKNRLFSLALAVCLTWSYNLYVGLFFGGTAGYAATQMFLPLVLYLVVKYYKTKSQRFLLLAAFFLGLSFWGHTGLTVSLVFVPTLIILFFWSDKANKFLSLKKIGDLLLFCFLALLIALFALYPTLYSIVNVSQEQASGIGFGFSSNAYPEALSIFIKSNNLYIFAALAAAILLVFILKRLKELNEAKAFFLLALYLLAFEWLYTIGRNPIANAIGPDRTYFALSLVLAGLLAALFRSLGPSFTSFSQIWKAKHKERYSLYLKIGLIGILFFGVFQISDTKELIKNKMGNSSLLPNEINDTLVNNKEVPKGTVPSWLSTDDKNYRLYEINNSVNIWWNIVYNLPIVKGYFPVMPSQSAVNWLYWADQTFIGEIVKHFNTPESVAKNSALFLLDWYGVKYLDNQGEPFSVAKYLQDEPNLIKNKVTEAGLLQFMEVSDDFTSPIVRPLNSPTLLVMSDDNSYDTFCRVLGMENLNSRSLVPIHGEASLEKLNQKDLADFDGIFLYNYKYRSDKIWQRLQKYVEEGGFLFIETGSEVKESQRNNLPEVFPIKQSFRKDLGKEWSLSAGEEDITLGLDFAKFSPLVFEDLPWKLSYAEKEAVRPWAKIILSQKDKPIMVAGQLGKGRVIWSGMSLAYHLQTYQNFEESKLWKNILGAGLNLKSEEPADYRVDRKTPEEIKIEGADFSGVLFKESYFPGWEAKAGAEKLPVYRAGLNFMYVRVPAGTDELTFKFKGAFIYQFLFILSGAALLLIIFMMIFGTKIFKKIILKFGVSKKVSKWWEKDDEE